MSQIFGDMLCLFYWVAKQLDVLKFIVYILFVAQGTGTSQTSSIFSWSLSLSVSLFLILSHAQHMHAQTHTCLNNPSNGNGAGAGLFRYLALSTESGKSVSHLMQDRIGWIKEIQW
ncbi:hypothetical protein ACOSQ2_020928 [Xanthoceras sorbifolium]